jgi:hypothetical protein
MPFCKIGILKLSSFLPSSLVKQWQSETGILPLPLPTPIDGSSSLSDELSNSDISTTLSS